MSGSDPTYQAFLDTYCQVLFHTRWEGNQARVIGFWSVPTRHLVAKLGIRHSWKFSCRMALDFGEHTTSPGVPTFWLLAPLIPLGRSDGAPWANETGINYA